MTEYAEKWTLFDDVELEPNEDRAAQVAETLGLDSLYQVIR